jgi:hypothetical protein
MAAERPEENAASAATMGWGGRPPTASMCQSGGVELTTAKEASVGEVSTIGLDLAKMVFQAHGADASGGVLDKEIAARAKQDPVAKQLMTIPGVGGNYILDGTRRPSP